MKAFEKALLRSCPGSAGRAPVIALAVLFLAAALLSSLPSPGELFDLLERDALAGYESTVQTTPRRDPVLEEYYDTPAVSQPDAAETSQSPLQLPVNLY